MEPTKAVRPDGGRTASRDIIGFGPSHPGVFRDKSTLNGRVLFDARITIDEHLLRKTGGPKGPHALVFFGDSFTFGDGLDDADTLPQSFADLRKEQGPVQNLAYSGWSPAQGLAILQFDLETAVIDHPRRFVLVTAAWHAERTSCKAPFSKRSPRYAIVGGTPTYEGRCIGAAAAAWQGFLSRFAVYRVLLEPVLSRPSASDIDGYVRVVDAFVATAKAKYGVPTTIVFLPSGDAYLKHSGWTEAALEEALRHSGADVIVDTLPPIADPKLYTLEGDGHPTGLANRARAKEIADHLDALDSASLAHESASNP